MLWRTFTGRGATTSAANNVSSITVAMNVAYKRLVLSVNHGYLRIGMCTKKPSPRNSKRKATAASKKLLEAMDDSVEIYAPEETLGPQEKKRVRSRTDHRTTSRNPGPTNQLQRAVPAEFSCRSYARWGLMAHPGPRRARIGITDVPGMRISARTVAPATVVPLGTHRNGDVHSIATAVTIDICHHRQDVLVT